MSETTSCARCSRPLRYAPRRTEGARPMRGVLSGRGMCANCCATAFLKDLEASHGGILNVTPEKLRAPQVQAQFARMMVTGGADADPAEVDWELVIATWELPMPGFVKRERF